MKDWLERPELLRVMLLFAYCPRKTNPPLRKRGPRGLQCRPREETLQIPSSFQGLQHGYFVGHYSRSAPTESRRRFA